ncbi:MAG: hypothetical protein Ta2F_05940 [Termitinemataceae bacterium]|nr:MAG: hypothetical protein Ta2F_05940 [Termitinemataceae bacterium]
MTIVIVSLNGVDNSGGLERVSFYLKEILEKQYAVKIISRMCFSFGKLDLVLQPFFIALRLFFIRNKFVISNSWNSFFYPADLSIHHGTSAGMLYSIPELRSISTRLLAFMEKESSRTAKKIIAVSQSAKEEITKYYKADAKKIIVLNNFVDENIFFPSNEHDESKTTILFCGRLEIRKGVDILKKLSDYIETIDGYALYIACNNSENINLFKGNKNTKIHAGVKLKDMCAFYNSGDILFFPTRYEGFSMSTLEALSCGIPVLGTSEAVKDNLADYNFIQIVDCTELDDTATIIQKISLLVTKWRNKKNKIHQTVVKDFGYLQYEDKILKLIQEKYNV